MIVYIFNTSHKLNEYLEKSQFKPDVEKTITPTDLHELFQLEYIQ